mmetsp:Transcript_77172/g.206086  ORF Transcript_77172/g.206086 Transcript_77172/m.206086 type:complete len:273 (-) Transcript_77172:170-988(-)
MLQALLHGGSQFGRDQNPADPVPRVHREEIRKDALQRMDPLVRVFSCTCSKRCLANQQLVNQDSPTPHIHKRIVPLFLQNFRRQVLWSAAKRRAPAAALCRPTKIGDFDSPISTHQHILRLQVSVNHTLLLQMLQRLPNLTGVGHNHSLLEAASRLQYSDQSATSSILQHQIQLLLVLKPAMSLDNVAVLQSHMNLQLPDQLMLKLAPDKLLLSEHFDRERPASLELLNEENLSEPTLTEPASEAKITANPLRHRLLCGGWCIGRHCRHLPR